MTQSEWNKVIKLNKYTNKYWQDAAFHLYLTYARITMHHTLYQVFQRPNVIIHVSFPNPDCTFWHDAWDAMVACLIRDLWMWGLGERVDMCENCSSIFETMTILSRNNARGRSELQVVPYHLDNEQYLVYPDALARWFGVRSAITLTERMAAKFVYRDTYDEDRFIRWLDLLATMQEHAKTMTCPGVARVRCSCIKV